MTDHLFGDPTNPASPTYYTPNQTLVLFLDYHSFFVQSLNEAGQTAASHATTLATWARSIPSLHIGHVLISSSGTPFSTCKNQAQWTGVIQLLGSDESKYAEPEGIAAQNGEMVWTRQAGYVSALACAELKAYVDAKGIRALVLCGLTTSRCVMFTALAAAESELVVTVVEDACADRSGEAHEASREVMEGRCWVASVEQVVGRLFKG